MDQIVINEHDRGAVIAKTAGATYNPAIDISICRIGAEGELVGGVVYTDYTGESISAHIAGFHPHWINRDMLYVMFDYPFKQLQVKRIFGYIKESNYEAIAINAKFGFVPVTRIEGVFPDNVACLVMRLDREDCRFLNVRPRTIVGRQLH